MDTEVRLITADEARDQATMREADSLAYHQARCLANANVKIKRAAQKGHRRVVVWQGAPGSEGKDYAVASHLLDKLREAGYNATLSNAGDGTSHIEARW